MTLKRKSGGSMVDVTSVKRRSGGTWVAISEVRKRAGGVWVKVWPIITGPTVAMPDLGTVLGYRDGNASPPPTFLGGSSILTIAANGTYSAYGTDNTYPSYQAGTVITGTWLTSGAASDVQVYVSGTMTGTTSLAGGAAYNTWITVTADMYWGITSSSNQTGSIPLTVQFRRLSDSVVIDTATATMQIS